MSEVDVTGTLVGIQALTSLMSGSGSVVIVGSVAALTGHFPVAYTASKWALRGLAKAACLELGPRGIRVNTVHPGYIETPMTASAAPAFRAANVAETPLGRTGTVDEVAPLVLFLVSDESSFISGAEIPVEYAHRSYEQAVNSPKRELRVFTPDEGATEHIGLDHLPHVSTYITRLGQRHLRRAAHRPRLTWCRAGRRTAWDRAGGFFKVASSKTPQPVTLGCSG